MGMTTSTPRLNPTPAIIYSDYVDFGTKRANEERGTGGKEPCVLCGRGLTEKAIDNGWWVEMGHGGLVLFHTADEPDTADPGYMGFFPLGSECAKRIPATHRQKIP